MSDRIAEAFAGHGKRAALMPYLMGGFPSLDGIQQILDTTTVPGGKAAKPEQFVDMSFVQQIKASGLIDHGSRHAFEKMTGSWPGEEQPEHA